MKRSASTITAFLLLLLVLGMASIRPRISPEPVPLARSPCGVVLIAVAHCPVVPWSPSENAPYLSSLAERGPVGLMPTRSGGSDDDFAVALRMLLSGSRSPSPEGSTLPKTIPGEWEMVPANGPKILNAAHAAPNGSVLFVSTDAASSLKETDRLVGALTAADGLPDGWSVLIVGATPTAGNAARRERVAPVLLWQRQRAYSSPALLTSPSVRNQPGLVAATDVGATVAALLDLPSDRRIGDGRAMAVVALPRSAGGSPTWFLWRRGAEWGQQAREQHLLPALPWCLAALLIVAVFAPWAAGRRGARAAALTAPLALLTVAPLVPTYFPALTFSPYTVYALAAIPVVICAIVAAWNERLGERLPRLLAIATALTIAVDTLLGGPLLSRTPLSYSVLEAARFYGIGNEASGLLLGAAVVAIGAETPVTAGLFGAALAIVSAAPQFGADAGGFIATLIAFTTFVLVRRARGPIGGKVVGAALIAAACILAAVAGFALWDANRGPARRTHVGEAVAAMKTDGIEALTTIAVRKLAVNARLSVTSPWAALFATEVALVLWMRRRKKRASGQIDVPTPAVDVALLTATLALYALNDSGVVAAATCGLWAFALRSDSPP